LSIGFPFVVGLLPTATQRLHERGTVEQPVRAALHLLQRRLIGLALRIEQRERGDAACGIAPHFLHFNKSEFNSLELNSDVSYELFSANLKTSLPSIR
jgi:hypothetical protein